MEAAHVQAAAIKGDGRNERTAVTSSFCRVAGSGLVKMNSSWRLRA